MHSPCTKSADGNFPIRLMGGGGQRFQPLSGIKRSIQHNFIQGRIRRTYFGCLSVMMTSSQGASFFVLDQ